MKAEKNTIREIARMAKVSTATVSRAVNTPEKVNPETLENIRSIMTEMGYVPGHKKKKQIVCITADTTNLFCNEVISRLSVLAKDEGFLVSVHLSNGDADLEQELIRKYQKEGISGILLTGFCRVKNIRSDVPVCIIDTASAVRGNYCSISSDNEKAISILIDHLIRLNHRKIGFISGGVENAAGKVREMIFREQMAARGMEVSESMFFNGDFRIRGGIEAFDYFYSLPDMPTAILSSNDEMAKGFIIRAFSMGVRIPDEISVCGVDGLPDDIFLPKITSVSQNTDQIAKEALDFIRKTGTYPENAKILIPVVYRPGNTTYRRAE